MKAKENLQAETVRAQLLGLEKMNMAQLIEKWRSLFLSEPPEYGIVFMRRRLACRIQELTYGGVSDEAMQRLKSINNRISRANRQLRLGTQIKRIWNGEEYLVTVSDSGYEYGGMIYKSLSGVAKKITGANWNGHRFFGFQKEG